MKNKFLVRVVSLCLVPCLVADPAAVSACTDSFAPAGERGSFQAPFQEQAFQARLAQAFRVPLLTVWIWRSEGAAKSRFSAIGKGSSKDAIPDIELQPLTKLQRLAVDQALEKLREISATGKNPDGEPLGPSDTKILRSVINELDLFLTGSSWGEIGTFSAVVKDKEDYLLCFARPPGGKRKIKSIGLANEVLEGIQRSSHLRPLERALALAEVLFHEGYASLHPEEDEKDHARRYQHLQRRILGQANLPKGVLREVIDAKAQGVRPGTAAPTQPGRASLERGENLARLPFGTRLRSLRSARGMSLSKMGIDPGELSLIERGRVRYIRKQNILEALSHALGMPLDILLTGVSEESFGRWLKDLRQERGEPLSEFAKLLNMQPIHLQLLEDGQVKPTLDDLRQYASTSWVLFGGLRPPKAIVARRGSVTVEDVVGNLKETAECLGQLQAWRQPWENLARGLTLEVPYRPESWLRAIANGLSQLDAAKLEWRQWESRLSPENLGALARRAGVERLSREILEEEIAEGLRLFGTALSLARSAYGIPTNYFDRSTGGQSPRICVAESGHGPGHIGPRWAQGISRAIEHLCQGKPYRAVVLHSAARDTWQRLVRENDLSIGRAVKTRREAMKMDQDELAARAVLDSSAVADIEKGKYGARPKHVLEKLAGAFGTSCEDLFANLREYFQLEEGYKERFLSLVGRAVQTLRERRRQRLWDSRAIGRQIGRSEKWFDKLIEGVNEGGGIRFDLDLLQDLAKAGLAVDDLWPQDDLIRVSYKPPVPAPWGPIKNKRGSTVAVVLAAIAGLPAVAALGGCLAAHLTNILCGPQGLWRLSPILAIACGVLVLAAASIALKPFAHRLKSSFRNHVLVFRAA